MRLYRRLVARARAEDGFGLIELMAAMLVLNVGILALVTAFSSGQVALARASRTATAASLADQQMELYRAIKYTSILLDATAVNGADTTYKCDASYGTDCDPVADADTTKIVKTTTCTTPLTNQCNPSRAATGADGKQYRVDTYITEDLVSGGRPVRRVTVVVRNPNDLTQAPWARQSSNFDESTA